MKRFKRAYVWLLMITKKYFKDIGFLLTFFAISLIGLSMYFMSGNDEAVVRVAMYSKPDAADSQKLMDKMVNLKGKAVLFYRTDSMEKLIKDVKSGYAASGFELPDNLSETLKNYACGNYEKLQFGRAVAKYYYIEDTNYTSIACELFYAGLYKEYAKEVFRNHMESRAENSNMEESDWEEAEEYYNSYNIDTELFVFENIDGTVNKAIAESRGFLMLSVRGLIYALVLLATMLGALTSLRDEKKGIFLTLPYKKRPFYVSSFVLIPAVFSGISALITIAALDLDYGIIRELRIAVLFVAVVSCVALITKSIFKNTVVFATLIPMYVMANVLLCNVFVDVSSMFPYVAVIRKGLPLYYALTGF